ncbi:MAG: hypothetical protein ABIS84_04585 [Arachnia sp.]
MDVVIVLLLLLSPLLAVWLSRARAPRDGSDSLPPPEVPTTSPEASHSTHSPATSRDGLTWSALDDYQVTRLLNDADRRTDSG